MDRAEVCATLAGGEYGLRLPAADPGGKLPIDQPLFIPVLKQRKNLLHPFIGRAIINFPVFILHPVIRINTEGIKNGFQAEGMIVSGNRFGGVHGKAGGIINAVAVRILFHKGGEHLFQVLHGFGHFQSQIVQPVLTQPQHILLPVQVAGRNRHQASVYGNRLQVTAAVGSVNSFDGVGNVLLIDICQICQQPVLRQLEKGTVIIAVKNIGQISGCNI